MPLNKRYMDIPRIWKNFHSNNFSDSNGWYKNNTFINFHEKEHNFNRMEMMMILEFFLSDSIFKGLPNGKTTDTIRCSSSTMLVKDFILHSFN